MQLHVHDHPSLENAIISIRFRYPAGFALAFRPYADPAVKVIAVNYREDGDKVPRFMAEHDVHYTVVTNPDGTVARAFRAPGMPYCVILGRSGTVVYRGSMLPENIE